MRKILLIFILVWLYLGVIFFRDNILTKKEKRKAEEINITQKIVNKQNRPADEITLISTGDIGLVRDVNYRIQQKGDMHYPFLGIAGYLRDADLTVINLEGPLIKNCPIILTGFTFCGDSENVKGLTFAGIDAASLANNHTTNYGPAGLSETINILEAAGIAPYGVEGKVNYIDIKKRKVALVGFVELENSWEGLNNATEDNVSKVVSTAHKNADVVVVSFHWGVEYTHNPTQEQISLAHLAIDRGADIILGNHPHWIQSTEIYKGKFITYAQGNTIFDQDWSQETKEGVIYKFAYKNGKFEKIDEKYTIIEDNSQPRFATPEETAIIKAKLGK